MPTLKDLELKDVAIREKIVKMTWQKIYWFHWLKETILEFFSFKKEWNKFSKISGYGIKIIPFFFHKKPEI